MSSGQRPKVCVGLSGGVDSSVAAALLLERGYEVVGAFMKNWSDEEADPCTGDSAWRRERQDALRVALQLGIPFHTFDFEREYRAGVVDYMVREYAAGRTPNPDVMCNKLVKFDLFLAKARELGCDLMATGHYARRRDNPDGTASLLAGVDANKDQSYFLHQLSQAQLQAALFPVGELTKPEVRAKAAELGLVTAAKKDSQGICFIGKVKLADFLGDRIRGMPGPIVNTSGEKVGEHDGLAPFTVGQRHGMNLGGGDPYFVVGKDLAAGALVVSRDPRDLEATALTADGVSWIRTAAPPLPLRAAARIRYRQPLQPCTAEAAAAGALTVRFDGSQRAVSPGQFVVFYDGDECLGGGVIRA
jgi:tRNA-specific 2-thiouridylase